MSLIITIQWHLVLLYSSKPFKKLLLTNAVAVTESYLSNGTINFYIPYLFTKNDAC